MKRTTAATACVTQVSQGGWLLEYKDAKNRTLFAAGYKTEASAKRAAWALIRANWLVLA